MRALIPVRLGKGPLNLLLDKNLNEDSETFFLLITMENPMKYGADLIGQVKKHKLASSALFSLLTAH